MKSLLAPLMFLVLFSGSVMLSAPPQKEDKRNETLQKEREKLKRKLDPVDRTKTQIKISEILLTFIGDSVKSNDFEQLAKLLDDYRTAIQDAHQTMLSTGRNAHAKPKGFKDLEIAMRRQVRRLEDIGGGLSFDRREPVEKAKTEAAHIQNQMIRALLLEELNAEQNAPVGKS